MKKIISLLLSVAMLLSITAGLDLSAYAFTSGEWEYEVYYDGTAELTDYTGSETNLTIPSVLDGYTVTSIGGGVFYDCNSLTNITIPNSVTSIGSYAFSDCDSLTNITIPNSVTSIGSYAFSNCYSLTNITIPNSVTSIGYAAFSWCSSLADITIPESITSIGEGAFSYCSVLKEIIVAEKNENYSSQDGALFNKEKTELIQYPVGNERTSYTVPAGVTSIGVYAFDSCSALEQITIPKSVTSIGDGAFNSCSALEQITIPESVTNIGDYAFSYCSVLKEIIVAEKNENYSSQDGALFNKEKTELIQYPVGNERTSYTVPAGVTSIGDEAFSLCNALVDIIIPESVTSIGWGAFSGCSALVDIIIPESVTNIGDYAFSYCSALKEIIVAEKNENYSSQDGALFNKEKTELIQYPVGNERTSYTVPAGVTSIGDEAFSRCSALEQITIPESVTSIDYGAFSECNALVQITILNPECDIDDVCTIPDTAAIYGYKGSTAQAYAEKYERKFVPINGGEPSADLPAPKNLVLSNTTTSGVTVSFDKVPGADGYEIQYYHNGKWIHYVNTGYWSKAWTGWGAAGTFDIRVRAYVKSDSGVVYSNNWSEVKRFYTKPNQVTGVKTASRSADGTSLTITWDQQKWATGYCVYKKGSNNKWWLIATIYGPTENSYTITGLTPTYDYSYKVRAFKGGAGNLGAYSAEHSTYASPAQTKLYTVASNASKKLYVSWIKQHCYGYELMISTTRNFSANNTSYYISGENNNKITVTPPKANTKYYVRVRCYYKKASGNVYSVWTGPQEINVK